MLQGQDVRRILEQPAQPDSPAVHVDLQVGVDEAALALDDQPDLAFDLGVARHGQRLDAELVVHVHHTLRLPGGLLGAQRLLEQAHRAVEQDLPLSHGDVRPAAVPVRQVGEAGFDAGAELRIRRVLCRTLRHYRAGGQGEQQQPKGRAAKRRGGCLARSALHDAALRRAAEGESTLGGTPSSRWIEATSASGSPSRAASIAM